MKTSVSTKGQVVLPSELPALDNIELVDWLLSCPDKGYFVPIESESTDTL